MSSRCLIVALRSSVPLSGKGSMVTYWLLQPGQAAPLDDPLVIAAKMAAAVSSSPSAADTVAMGVAQGHAFAMSEQSDCLSGERRAASNGPARASTFAPPQQYRARGETIQVNEQDLSRYLGNLNRLKVTAVPAAASYNSSSRGTMASVSRRASDSSPPDSRRASRDSCLRVRRPQAGSDSGQTSPGNLWSPRSDGSGSAQVSPTRLDDIPTRASSMEDCRIQIDTVPDTRRGSKERRLSERVKRPSHAVVPMEALLEEEERESKFCGSVVNLINEGLPLHIDLDGANWQVSCL